MARENPEPAVWVALAVGAAAVAGVAIYVATRPSATTAAPPPPPLTGPAITNPVTSVESAANRALVAQATASAAAAAAQAAAIAPLVNTTYQMPLAAAGPSATTSLQLKVGDTVQIVPSIYFIPPTASQWTYTPDGTQNILQELGSADGSAATFKATAPGSGTLLVQNVAIGNQAEVFMTYDLNVVVTAT